MNVVKKDDAKPVCPFCEAELDQLWSKELKSSFGKRYVYFCPECNKVLGVSHRKGFWMG
ncbi:MAG: hypothetical protein ACOCRL_02335 [Bacillota bacterium]